MATPQQIKTIKTSQRKLALDDAHYRMILRTVGHVESCRDLDNAHYERVLATLEELGSQRTPPIQIGSTPDYWRTRASIGGNRLGWKIEALYANYLELTAHLPEEDLYQLFGLVAKCTGNRTREIDQMTSYEQYALVECLKGIIYRLEQESPPTPPSEQEHLEAVPF